MSKDNTQELDDLCPICNGSMWQMNADYEEVPCWHDIHDRDIKQAIRRWAVGSVGEDEGLVEVTKRNLVTASRFNAVIKSRNQLRETIRKKLMEAEL